MTKDLADELERLATKLHDEPDAARRIYRTAALSLWVENNLPQILSALRAKPAEGEPVACPDRDRIAVCISTHLSLGLGIDLPCVEVDKIADAILALSASGGGE